MILIDMPIWNINLETENFGVLDIMWKRSAEKKVIEEYIRNQKQDDIVAEQISMMEYIDPFTGEEVKKKKR